MIEVRIHGRGGQGVVIASKILVAAAVAEGKHANSIPDFTFERRGAPVKAFVRISDEYIFEKTQVYHPDILVVFDLKLKTIVNFYEGIKENCTLVVNSPDIISFPEKIKTIGYIDANKIVAPFFGIPVVNTCMLGAFAKTTRIISLESLIYGINEILENVSDEALERNIRFAEEGFNQTKIVKKGDKQYEKL